MTEAQQIITQEVEAFKQECNEAMKEMGIKPANDDWGLYYYFHTDNSVSVDGYLYDILAHGQSEFGFGRDLAKAIEDALKKAGYYLERVTSCDYRIEEAV